MDTMRVYRLRILICWLLPPLIALGWWTSPAAAHSAVLLKSEPAAESHVTVAPETVTLWFVEELISADSQLAVFNAAGEQVDIGEGGVDLYDPDHASMLAHLPTTLPNGVYTVRWQVKLVDGDETENAFRFAVGEDVVLKPVAPDASAAAGDSSATNHMLMWIVAIVVGAVAITFLMLTRFASMQPEDARNA